MRLSLCCRVWRKPSKPCSAVQDTQHTEKPQPSCTKFFMEERSASLSKSHLFKTTIISLEFRPISSCLCTSLSLVIVCPTLSFVIVCTSSDSLAPSGGLKKSPRSFKWLAITSSIESLCFSWARYVASKTRIFRSACTALHIERKITGIITRLA